MSGKVDIFKFAQTHHPDCLYSVLQFLQVFDWDSEAKEDLELIIGNHEEALRSRAEARKAGRKIRVQTPSLDIKAASVKKDGYDKSLEQPPMHVVGICPKCNSTMRGEPVSNCERKVSNRVFYKECSACTYYVEVFQGKRNKNKFTEVEGG